MCAWTDDTVAPVTDTAGVSAANDATASLNVTTTCGRSSVPLCDDDVKALSGKLADSTASSVLRMVPVAILSAISAPTALLSTISKVSPLSLTVSSMIGTEMVIDVSPGLKVSVPLVAV